MQISLKGITAGSLTLNDWSVPNGADAAMAESRFAGQVIKIVTVYIFAA